MIQRKRRKARFVLNKANCEEIDRSTFREVAVLAKYVSDRGRILGRERTGLSAKHQRRMAKLVKQARHLGLLPFVNS